MPPPLLSHPTKCRRRAALSAGLAFCALAAALAPPAVAAPAKAHVIVVRFARGTGARARAAAVRAAGGARVAAPASHTRVIHLAPGISVRDALARLRQKPGVLWAVRDYIAHASSYPGISNPAQVPATPPPSTGPAFIPNDTGVPGGAPGDWQKIQWNFAGPFSVNAPQAWRNLISAGHPGGAGVLVAVLDTGIAYANRGRFRRSPDFGSGQFVRGYDFVDNNPYPVDHNGHGTHVAGTLAEATNNGFGLTGLAYGVRIVPVRVLDSQGDGDAATIAAGVVYAVRRHVQIINMSLEFTSDVSASSIPELIAAIRFAHRHGVLVVGAAGNEGASQIAYPARARYVLAVGATTEHGCLSDFSNDGPGLDLVAPGGGADAPVANDPNCHPGQPPGRDIYQETLIAGSVKRFGLPPGYEGTSMAVPHVSATAALVIASGVLGPRPTPEAIVTRLKATTRPLGPPGDTRHYGAGLIDAAAATFPGGPGAVAPPPPAPPAPPAPTP